MFKKLFSYIRKLKLKKNINRDILLMKDFYITKEKLEEMDFSRDNVKAMLDIVIKTNVSFSKGSFKNNTIKVLLYSKSCLKALKLIESRKFDNFILSQALEFIDTERYEGSFISWYSNELTLSLFDKIIKNYMSMYIDILYTDDINKLDNPITEKDKDFLFSILFRYLVLDYINLYELCLRGKHEQNKNED